MSVVLAALAAHPRARSPQHTNMAAECQTCLPAYPNPPQALNQPSPMSKDYLKGIEVVFRLIGNYLGLRLT